MSGQNTPLDISKTVTVKQYRAVLDSLLGQLKDWQGQNNWCSEFWRQVNRLSASLVYDRYGEVMRYIVPDTGEERASDLRDIRGRILEFVNDSGEVSLDKANGFLSGAGLAPYVPEAPAENNFRLYLPNVSLTTTLGSQEVEDKFREFLIAVGADHLDREMSDVEVDDHGTSAVVPPDETVGRLRYIR